MAGIQAENGKSLVNGSVIAASVVGSRNNSITTSVPTTNYNVNYVHICAYAELINTLYGSSY